LPAVKGLVIEVPVENRTNQHLEAGEVLFKIDPKPYEYVVEQKRAGLAEAEAQVAELKAPLIRPRHRPQSGRPNSSSRRKTSTDNLI
jgi:multidrug resistance efflux pump